MTPEEWANVVEVGATALASARGSDCFGPLRDTAEWQADRDRFRDEARTVLNAVQHRARLHDAEAIDRLLRDHGHEYPLGPRGVADALNQRDGLLEEWNSIEWVRKRLAELERMEVAGR